MRRRVWCALLAGVTAVVLLWSGPADAGPSSKDRAAARKLAGEAMDLFTAGDYDAALDKFSEADELVPAPTLKLRVARCLDKLDRMKEAAEKYREVIAFELKAFAPAVHREARKQAVPELAELLEQVPSVTVLVDGAGSAEATVAMDGEPIGWAVGEDHELDPGHYAFEADAGGGRTAHEEIHLARGEHLDVVLSLPAMEEGVGPAAQAAADDGSGLATAGWVAIGVGGVGLTVGVITGAMVLAQEGDLEERCPDRQCLPDAHEDADAFDRLRVTSTVGFVIGGVGLATGVTLLLLSPSSGEQDADEAEPEARLEPWLGLGSAGLRGTF